MNESISNEVLLTGTVASELEFNHTIYGETFYNCNLKIPRLSGQADALPITISDRLLKFSPVQQGDRLAVIGQLRSYNKLVDGLSRLVLVTFVREIREEEEYVKHDMNKITLEGFLCKKPIFRATPFGREITDLLLAVNRGYNKSDYIPCIAWGRNARFASTFEVGDRIRLDGRVQSREYEKKDEEGNVTVKTAYEVSIARIELVDNTDNTDNTESTF